MCVCVQIYTTRRGKGRLRATGNCILLPRAQAGFYAGLPRNLRTLDDVIVIRRPVDASGARTVARPIRPKLLIMAIDVAMERCSLLRQYANRDPETFQELESLLVAARLGGEHDGNTNPLLASVDVSGLLPAVNVPDPDPEPLSAAAPGLGAAAAAAPGSAPNSDAAASPAAVDPMQVVDEGGDVASDNADQPQVDPHAMESGEPTFIPMLASELTEAQTVALGLIEALDALKAAQTQTLASRQRSGGDPFLHGGMSLVWPNVDIGAAPVSESTPGLLTLAFPDLFASHPEADPTVRQRERGYSARGDGGIANQRSTPTVADGFAHLVRSCQQSEDETGRPYLRFPFVEHPQFVFFARNFQLRQRAQGTVARFQAANPEAAACTLDELNEAVASAKRGDQSLINRLARGLIRQCDQSTGQPGYWRSLQRANEATAETHGQPNLFTTYSAADNHWPALRRVLRPGWTEEVCTCVCVYACVRACACAQV